MAYTYVSKQLVATPVEQSVVVTASKLKLVSNDNSIQTGGNLLFSFEKSIADGEDTIVLQPGESGDSEFFNNMPVGIMYYKSDSGNVNFRIFGTKT